MNDRRSRSGSGSALYGSAVCSSSGGSDDDVDLAVVHLDRERLRTHARVHERSARLDVELPAVPGAAEDAASASVLVAEVVDRQRRSRERPRAERAAAVGAAVVERVEAPVDVEDADAPSVELADHALAGRQ